jgi:hypothetical protein
VREQHVAQIAPAGAWRVWAEPETQGEAYIPLASSKRARSKEILVEVAHRFPPGWLLSSPRLPRGVGAGQREVTGTVTVLAETFGLRRSCRATQVANQDNSMHIPM